LGIKLFNNALKYAQAINIFIQINHHERGISLTVEDDGRGFDPNFLQNQKGTGLENIQSRVDYLKGQFSIVSAPGQGYSFNIEIPKN
jgi:two-component system, NarL family, sensor kinase